MIPQYRRPHYVLGQPQDAKRVCLQKAYVRLIYILCCRSNGCVFEVLEMRYLGRFVIVRYATPVSSEMPEHVSAQPRDASGWTFSLDSEHLIRWWVTPVHNYQLWRLRNLREGSHIGYSTSDKTSWLSQRELNMFLSMFSTCCMFRAWHQYVQPQMFLSQKGVAIVTTLEITGAHVHHHRAQLRRVS